MTRTRCCWHGMLKVKATVTSVSKRMEALISNVHTTHKDSKLLTYEDIHRCAVCDRIGPLDAHKVQQLWT